MIDTAVLEYYKLAAAVIPVLWVGQAFQFLGPEASRRQIELLGSEARETSEKAERLKKETEQWARGVQEWSKAIAQKIAEPSQKVMDEGWAKEQLAGLKAEKAQAEGDTRSGDLRNKANELVHRQHTLKTGMRRLALLAVVAVPAAFLSEALSLYGVYDDNSATFITVIVTTGLALGGVLLIAPLWVGWIQLRAWLYEGRARRGR
jgi:hypothetical protein